MIKKHKILMIKAKSYIFGYRLGATIPFLNKTESYKTVLFDGVKTKIYCKCEN